MTEKVKFTYHLVGKTFEKQLKTTETQGREQVQALKVLKPTE